MVVFRVLILLCVFFCTVQCATNRPLIVAHRGTPSHRVEETFPSYELAASYHADFIEADLCVTSDHYLVLRHECNLDETTDVAQHPEFASRQKKAEYGQRSLTEAEGWFTENFTLAEIRTLRTKERLSEDVRTHAYDGLYQIITLDEFLQNAFALRGNNSMPPVLCGDEDSSPLGLYIETKTPAYFRTVMPDFDFENALLTSLEKWGLKDRCQKAKDSQTDSLAWIKECGVILQSFENNLSGLDCPYPLVQLLENDGKQADTGMLYTDLMTEPELTKIKQWAVGIGPAKDSCLNYTDYTSTGLIERAHSVGLMVHPYTFRPEPYYMKGTFDNNMSKELLAFFELGVDGVFTDSCDIAYETVEEWINSPDATSSPDDSLPILWIALACAIVGVIIVTVVIFVILRVRKNRASNQDPEYAGYD